MKNQLATMSSQRMRPHVSKFPCTVISCFQIYTWNLPISGSSAIAQGHHHQVRHRPAAGRCDAWQAAARPARRAGRRARSSLLHQRSTRPDGRRQRYISITRQPSHCQLAGVLSFFQGCDRSGLVISIVQVRQGIRELASQAFFLIAVRRQGCQLGVIPYRHQEARHETRAHCSRGRRILAIVIHHIYLLNNYYLQNMITKMEKSQIVY